MAQIKDLIVTGASRFLGNIYGTLKGNADTSTKATQDSTGQQINTTYIKGLSVSGKTITYTKGDGTTGTITTQDNNTTYAAGTGLSLSGTTFNHKNSVTAGTAQGDASKTLTFGGTFTIPTVSYDAQGHVTRKGTTTMTMPANPNTDTHWTTGITAGETGTTSNSATTNGNTFIKIKDNSTHRGQIKLVGSGATSVSSNAEGVITISSTDNNTTYGSMSVSEGTTGTATSNRVLTAANLKGIINAHAPTKTGGGASGTWGISISGNAATASKVNNKLTVGSKSYDGSAAVTIAASDLGLASAMLFLGTTTTAITDGATTNPVAISGSNKTVTAGNVVLYGSKEFVWTGSAWEELGNEGSYKIVQAAVADPSASGTSNTFIATISQDTNGKITATKKTVAVTNSAPTLAWGATSTIGTVAGTNLQVKMPANPNTDTKVTQTVTTSNAAYPLLLAPNGQTATTTTTSYFDSGVTLNPSTNTIAANVSGNAATATKLSISEFTTDTIDNVTHSGLLYGTVGSYTGPGFSSSDAMILSMSWNSSNNYGAQIALDDTTTPNMYVRNKNSSWSSWSKVLLSTNYTDYTVKKDGTGASGTWGINISGNATTATGLSAEITNDKLPARLRVNTSPTNANADTFKQSGFYYSTTGLPSGIDDANIFSINHTNGGWGHQLAFKFGGAGISGTPYDGADIYSRCYLSNTNSWSSWHALLSSGNYTKYTVTKTGGGASGTWGINITGNAATATALTSSAGNVSQPIYFGSGKPIAIDWHIGNSDVGEHNCNNVTYNFCGYYNSNGPSTSIGATTNDGSLWAQAWSSIWVTQIAQDYRNGNLFVRAKNNGTWIAWKKIWSKGDAVTGAVWNDYAEYREADTIQGGRCVREVGDDTLTLTTKRLMRGCSITSDTWGFAQGETEKAKTPIAVAGRVLAYPLEDRELFKEYIGYSVCSGPDGTVSLMTEEEELKYPWAIVGTVSAVPDYEEWGGGEMADRPSVKVDGRIWIRIR